MCVIRCGFFGSDLSWGQALDLLPQVCGKNVEIWFQSLTQTTAACVIERVIVVTIRN